MSYRKIRVCDCCGEILDGPEDTFHLILESERFTDAAGSMDSHVEKLDICDDCSRNIELSLKEITQRVENMDKGIKIDFVDNEESMIIYGKRNAIPVHIYKDKEMIYSSTFYNKETMKRKINDIVEEIIETNNKEEGE